VNRIIRKLLQLILEQQLN